MGITHHTQTAAANNPAYGVSHDAWDEGHDVADGTITAVMLATDATAIIDPGNVWEPSTMFALGYQIASGTHVWQVLAAPDVTGTEDPTSLLSTPANGYSVVVEATGVQWGYVGEVGTLAQPEGLNGGSEGLTGGQVYRYLGARFANDGEANVMASASVGGDGDVSVDVSATLSGAGAATVNAQAELGSGTVTQNSHATSHGGGTATANGFALNDGDGDATSDHKAFIIGDGNALVSGRATVSSPAAGNAQTLNDSVAGSQRAGWTSYADATGAHAGFDDGTGIGENGTPATEGMGLIADVDGHPRWGFPGVVPVGGIIMWSGSIATIPSGWALCNGKANSPGPDLRERFIVGASADAAGVAKTNLTGSLTQSGAAAVSAHTLSTSVALSAHTLSTQMAIANHTLTTSGARSSASGTIAVDTTTSLAHTITQPVVGDHSITQPVVAAHSITQPVVAAHSSVWPAYFALAFIQRMS